MKRTKTNKKQDQPPMPAAVPIGGVKGTYLTKIHHVSRFLSRVINLRLKGLIDNETARTLHLITSNLIKAMQESTLEQRIAKLEMMVDELKNAKNTGKEN